MRQINLVMRRVDVAAKRHRFARRPQAIGIIEEGFLVFHLEAQALLAALAVGQVGAHQRKVAIVGDDGAPFAVEFLDAQPEFDLLWLGLAEQADAAVAFAFRFHPPGMVTFGLAQFVVELIGPGFGLLNSQDIRLLGVQPIKKAFFLRGADAVHIP